MPPSFLKYFLFLVGIFSLQQCMVAESSEKKAVTSPNIILILLDDLGYSDVGFNGCKDIPTPNIDRIAQNGVKFTNGYVSYAVCGPSRAGLITGRYQDRFGFGRNPLFAPNDPNQGLPLSEQTLAAALATGGYNSMAIGKWHLGAHESQRPLKRGFNEFFGFLTGGHDYFPAKWTLNDISEVNSQFAAYKTKLLKNNQRIDENEYLTDALSREAVDFITRNEKTPFFLYLAYNAPHVPLQATDKYLDRFKHIEDKKRRTYAAMVSSVDDGVGGVLNQLEKMNLMENTLIFFLSDNGGQTKNRAENNPLKGRKGDLWEGGIRVPFAMQWKGKIPEGLTYEHPIISLDIFATAIAHAGVSPKNSIDGVDLIPFLKGEKKTTPHKHLYWRKFDAQEFAVRSGDFKIIRKKGASENLLFNLSSDISESKPIESAAVEHSLNTLYTKWNTNLLDPVFLGLRQNNQYNQLHPNRFITAPY